MRKYQKWSIAAVISWAFFFVVLFGGIIQKTSIFREYSCTVKKFTTEPRFECSKRCGITDKSTYNYERNENDRYDYLSAEDANEIMKELEQYDNVDMSEQEFINLLQYIELNSGGHHGNDDDNKYPDCDELERDTLEWYSPKLCLHAKWGFEDPLCPPETATCYTGKKWRRKCGLSCPLAYNVTIGLEVNHIGYIEKNRDLGTDRERYNSYKDSYKWGEKTTCQVIKGGSGEHEFLFVDERLSHETLQWWKWSIFSGSILMVLLTSVAAIVSYMRYRERMNRNGGGVEYAPIVNPEL